MPDVRPFAGLLYDPVVVGSVDSVTAPPYDTISPIDQDRYHRANPYNVIRLILGRSRPGDDEGLNKYTRAASHLKEWRAEGALMETPRPSLFPYELRFHHAGAERTIRGMIAEVALEPWGGSIVGHERTMPGPIEDRLELLRGVPANLSPVYAMFGGPSAQVTAFLARSMARPPAREALDGAGTRHRLWVAADGAEDVTEALRKETLLIADGHHRYTVALAYREEMRARFGPGPWDAMMMLLVDGATEDPPVLPIHRLVTSGLTALPNGEASVERVRDMAEVLASLRDDDLTYGFVTLDDGEPRHLIGRLPGSPPTVCALHERILDPAGVPLRFVPDAVAVEQSVVAGEAASAFVLPPTTVERVRQAIQDRGVLPEKSTYFWPKPRTGMVLRPMDVPG
jgi:uncharacterized protein (DUF1015 family)